jgi:hypothetical protein
MSNATLAVVSTAIPNADRRALSQAWYSALHLAPGSRAVALPPRRSQVATAPERTLPVQAPLQERGFHFQTAATRAERFPQFAASQVERRSLPAPLARSLVRAVAHHSPDRISSGIVLRTEEGRIHIIVRRDGTRVRLIALCVPAILDRVEKALAEARYALAARGFNVC